MTSGKRIAIVGAGPIGLEAALYARSLGFPTAVYEAGEPGAHVRSWGHVRLFTPWRLNVSPLGERRLVETGAAPFSERSGEPTGQDLLREYLLPLAGLPEMEGVVRTGTRVVAMGRSAMLKGDSSRKDHPFVLLIETPQGEKEVEADWILDATGTYGQPNPAGCSGIPASGERDVRDRIDGGLPDVLGKDRARYAGRRVLVVGGGLSAATTVTLLTQLPGTEMVWVTRAAAPPIEEIEDDPLPARLDLARRANRLASAPPKGFRHVSGSGITGFRKNGDALQVRLRGTENVVVDRVIVQTGFRPDASIHRELQVHQCYASEGPMKLAAALLGGAGGDCMTQIGFGPDSLTSPEPAFFIVGAKSYGRGSSFLLRIGREQVRDVFRLITEEPSLDLYASEKAHAG